MRKDSILTERGKRLNLLTLRSQICKLSSKQGPWKTDEKPPNIFEIFPSPHAYRPRSRTINRPRAGQAGIPLPSAGCVVIASKGGEAVGFKALKCGSFRLWEIVACIKSNVFIRLARLNPNG
jgi:hypothetical protein